MTDKSNLDNALAVLRKGSAEWQEYRRQQDPNFIPDFSGSDLSGLFLAGCDLSRGIFDGADLSYTDLSSSDLRGGSFRKANLENAVLTAAMLDNSDLTEAILRNSNLEEAELENSLLVNAKLHSANLRAADLSNADCTGASFTGASLQAALLFSTILGDCELTGTDFSTDIIDIDSELHMLTDLSRVIGLKQSDLMFAFGDSRTILPEGWQRPIQWAKIFDDEPVDPRTSDNSKTKTFAPQLTVVTNAVDREIGQKISSYVSNAGYDVTHLVISDVSRSGLIESKDLADSLKIMVMNPRALETVPLLYVALNAKQNGKLIPVSMDRAFVAQEFADVSHVVLNHSDLEEDSLAARALLKAVDSKLGQTDYQSIVSQLEQSNSTGFQFKDGKLTVGDKPLGALPERPHAEDLHQRTSAQLSLIANTIEEVVTHGRNFDTDQLVRRLHRYELTLRRGPTSWYEPDDAISSIASMMAREDAKNSWNEGVVDDLDRILARHREMEPLLRPVQAPPTSHEAIGHTPEAHLPEDENFAEKVSSELEQVADSFEFKEIADISVTRSLKEIASDIQEANSQDDFLPEQKKKKNSWLKKSLTQAAKWVAGITTTIAGGVGTAMAVSAETTTVVLSRLESLLQFLLKLF